MTMECSLNELTQVFLYEIERQRNVCCTLPIKRTFCKAMIQNSLTTKTSNNSLERRGNLLTRLKRPKARQELHNKEHRNKPSPYQG